MTQRNAYNLLLKNLANRTRAIPVQQEEIKLLDISRIILDGGWGITPSTFIEMLKIAEITPLYQQYIKFYRGKEVSTQ